MSETADSLLWVEGDLVRRRDKWVTEAPTPLPRGVRAAAQRPLHLPRRPRHCPNLYLPRLRDALDPHVGAARHPRSLRMQRPTSSVRLSCDWRADAIVAVRSRTLGILDIARTLCGRRSVLPIRDLVRTATRRPCCSLPLRREQLTARSSSDATRSQPPGTARQTNRQAGALLVQRRVASRRI